MDAGRSIRAVAAAIDVARSAGLRVDDAAVLHNSNRLAVNLPPSESLARVAPSAHRPVAAREVEVARHLAGTDAPIGRLDPRFEPRIHERDGFVITFWTYHASVGSPTFRPDEYASALERLHRGLRAVDLPDLAVPHVLDRVAEAQSLIDDPTSNAAIDVADRELLAEAIRRSVPAMVEARQSDQLIHGEPHPGNVLRTSDGVRFVDFETCCRGPVEFDLAHATADVGRPPVDLASHYPDVDERLLRACWILGLALATAWRCEPGDDLPNGTERAAVWIGSLREAITSEES